MNGSAVSRPEIVGSETRKTPFYLIGNEILDVFQPIMGPDCYTIYSHMARRSFKNPQLEHTIMDLKSATGLGASTVSRSLEVLNHVKLIQLIRRGGSQKSKCKLLGSEQAAERLGAKFQKGTLSWSLPEDVKQRLEWEVEAIRQRQQGKVTKRALTDCGNLPSSISQRNASVSPEIRQRATRETQTGPHLLQEERRIQNIPSPTPSHHCGARESKCSPDENEPNLLKWATSTFTGPMNDLRNHLLDTSKPPAPHLANGADEWQNFGLNSLAVEAASWRGKGLALVLSATDPTGARRGLEKYHSTWNSSLRKWFECEVHWDLQPAQQKR